MAKPDKLEPPPIYGRNYAVNGSGPALRVRIDQLLPRQTSKGHFLKFQNRVAVFIITSLFVTKTRHSKN